jgi:hypothetical protein
LSASLQATEKSSGVGATFFDESGKELSGRRVPPGASELIAKAAESRDIEFNFAVENTSSRGPVRVRRDSDTSISLTFPSSVPTDFSIVGTATARRARYRRHLLLLARTLSHDAAAETPHDDKRTR